MEFPRLIYPDASRIVFLESKHTTRGVQQMPVSGPDAADVAATSRSLDTVSITGDPMTVLQRD